jgi:hypothetical protein
MSKRPSLEAIAQGTTLQRDGVVTFQRDHVAALPPRRSLPHTSLYISKKVQKTLKEIALEYDRRPHDLLIEAVDLVLQRYGRPTTAELSDPPERLNVSTL